MNDRFCSEKSPDVTLLSVEKIACGLIQVANITLMDG